MSKGVTMKMNDNKATLVQILQLRKNKITWFPTFALEPEQ
jgi:hypothetical protein